MTHGTYIGSIDILKGKTALLQIVSADTLKAQFDDLKLPHEYTHGWTPFPATDFEVDRDD